MTFSLVFSFPKSSSPEYLHFLRNSHSIPTFVPNQQSKGASVFVQSHKSALISMNSNRINLFYTFHFSVFSCVDLRVSLLQHNANLRFQLVLQTKPEKVKICIQYFRFPLFA